MCAGIASQDRDDETIVEKLLEDGWTKIASGLWVKASMSVFIFTPQGGEAYREKSRKIDS